MVRGGLVALFAASACMAGETGQMTIVDESYTHQGWFRHIRFIEQPDDWTFPYDYHNGYTYTRCEVLRFNGEVDTIGLHYCYFQDRHTKDKHACTRMIKVHEPGVYYRCWRNSKMWQAGVIDWSRRLLNFMQIDNAVKGKGEADLRITVIIVADGWKLRPPPDWDCPADWDTGIGGTTEILSVSSNETVKASVKAGMLGSAWAAAERDSRSLDPRKAEEGRKVLAILDGYIRARREALAKIKTEDPVRAVDELVGLAKTFDRSPKLRELMAEASAWNREEATKRARVARSIYEQVRKTATLLKKKLGGKKASDPDMQRRHARDIHALRQASVALARKYPRTACARRAVALCEELGIALPQEVVRPNRAPP